MIRVKVEPWSSESYTIACDGCKRWRRRIRVVIIVDTDFSFCTTCWPKLATLLTKAATKR